MTAPADLYATFLAMEAEAKAEVARKHKLAVGMLTIEATREIAMRAAEQHGVPWPEARRVLIESFVPRAG